VVHHRSTIIIVPCDIFRIYKKLLRYAEPFWNICCFLDGQDTAPIYGTKYSAIGIYSEKWIRSIFSLHVSLRFISVKFFHLCLGRPNSRALSSLWFEVLAVVTTQTKIIAVITSCCSVQVQWYSSEISGDFTELHGITSQRTFMFSDWHDWKYFLTSPENLYKDWQLIFRVDSCSIRDLWKLTPYIQASIMR
jgi:hypothetical protein